MKAKVIEKRENHYDRLKSTGIKIKRNKILCIILKENKVSDFVLVKSDKEMFRHESNIYFIRNTGAYLDNNNTNLVMTFLEGISFPISHEYIKYEYVNMSIINDITGKKETHKIRKIKNLDFDSRAISIILNQKLAEMFTRIPMDMPSLILAILLIVTVALGFVNLGMWFF